MDFSVQKTWAYFITELRYCATYSCWQAAFTGVTGGNICAVCVAASAVAELVTKLLKHVRPGKLI